MTRLEFILSALLSPLAFLRKNSTEEIDGVQISLKKYRAKTYQKSALYWKRAAGILADTTLSNSKKADYWRERCLAAEGDLESLESKLDRVFEDWHSFSTRVPVVRQRFAPYTHPDCLKGTA